MLNDDVTWFQLKNRRIILELLAILNHLKSQNEGDLNLVSKINFLKTGNLEFLEKIFLSPEGRQWINLLYRELKKNGKEDPLLESYARWSGIPLATLAEYLVSRLDEFVFSLIVVSEEMPKDTIQLKMKSDFLLLGLGQLWQASEVLAFTVTPTDKVKIGISNKVLELQLQSCNDGYRIHRFKKMLGSDIFPLFIDLGSEASRINFPGREHLPRILSDDEESLNTQLQIIEAALGYIATVDSSIYHYFKEVPNYFVPLKGPEGTLPSSSNSSVDTMFWYSSTNQPLLMAEMIIHELSHQRLFRLQDMDPLLDPSMHGSGWENCEIYSPWRDDPRPVNGVFHGFVVFGEAARFWMSLIVQATLNETELDISKRRMAMLALQLSHARQSLKSCEFTRLGKSVFNYYAQELDGSLLPYLAKHNLAQLKPFFMEFHDQEHPSGANILEVVRDHKLKWETKNG